MKHSVLALILFFISQSSLRALDSSQSPAPTEGHAKSGDSVAPLVGYDPTYGFIIGGAYFHTHAETPIHSESVAVYGSFHNNYAIDLKAGAKASQSWLVDGNVGMNNFFDAYFGEGDETSPHNEIQIQAVKAYAVPAVGLHLSPFVSLRFLSEIRYREETGVNGVAGATIFGTELTPIFSVALISDHRDDETDSKKGRFLQARFDYGPQSLSTRKQGSNFARLLLELRQFYSLTSWLILDAHLQGGTSVGDPGYIYRWSLGGPNDMRGYQSNRLRGRHFYEAQAEMRVSLVKWLSVVAFAATGDTANVNITDFNGAKLTGGGGLRLGVPPDYVAKARLDFGVAPDEKNLYLSFNEAF